MTKKPTPQPELGGPGTDQQEPHAMVLREEPAASLPVAVGGASDLVQLAIEKDLDIEKLERLIALRDRERAAAAERAFDAAMAEFQRLCGPVTRGKLVDYVTKSGIKVHYHHATLADIEEHIKPYTSALGFSYSWSNTVEGNNAITTCTARHKDGHGRSASFPCPIASPNPGMTDQQKVGAALTFGQRYTLVQVFGLTTEDPDTDSVGPAEAAPVTEIQAVRLREMLELAGYTTEAKINKFLNWAKARSVETFPAEKFDEAIATLKKRVEEREAADAARRDS